MITKKQHSKFTELLNILNKEFSNCDGLDIKYIRSESLELSNIGVFLQIHLDELGIIEMNFIVANQQVVITRLVYKDILGYGYIPFNYEVKLKDKNKPLSPKNIKSVTRHFY